MSTLRVVLPFRTPHSEFRIPMPTRKTLGGVIHTYQKYDPVKFPSPTEPGPDLVSPAFEHLLMFGECRGFLYALV